MEDEEYTKMQAQPLPRPLRKQVGRIRTVEYVGERASDAFGFLESGLRNDLRTDINMDSSRHPPDPVTHPRAGTSVVTKIVNKHSSPI